MIDLYGKTRPNLHKLVVTETLVGISTINKSWSRNIMWRCEQIGIILVRVVVSSIRSLVVVVRTPIAERVEWVYSLFYYSQK